IWKRAEPRLTSIFSLRLLGLLDDFFYQMVRHFLVVREFHLERPTPAGHGAQVWGVGQDLGHRDRGFDDLVIALRIYTQQPATAPVEVTGNVADVLFRNRDLYGHDRLQQYRSGLFNGVLYPERTGDLER